jgi:hypothetical protein
MNFFKIKTIIMLMPLLVILVMTSGCAFGNRQLSLNPVYADNLPPKTTLKSQIHVAKPMDARNNQQLPNFIGYVRNGYYMHTADVIGDKNVDKWVQNCLVANLRKAGFKVSEEDIATKGLCVSAKIHSLKCDAYFSMKATVIVDVRLKKNNKEFFSQSFTGESSKLNWAASVGEYQQVVDKAMKLCLDKMMPVLIKELNKNAKN